jgi:hypothetical protein
MDSHHQLCASKAHALTLSYRAVSKWSVRLDSNQRASGYEPDALPLSYRPMKWSDTPVLPRALLGPKPSEFAGSLVSDEKWMCAPGSHWVMRCCRPLARLFALRTRMKWFRSADALVRSGHKLGFSVGSAPTLSLSQRKVLLLHHEKHLKCVLRPDWLRLRIVALRAGICRFAAWRSHRHRLVHNEEC